MVEREHAAGRIAGDGRSEAAANPAGVELGEASHLAGGTADPREEERHRRVMASAERVMRKHRNVFAALAK